MTEEQILAARIGNKLPLNAFVPPGTTDHSPQPYELIADGLEGLTITVYKSEHGQWYFSAHGCMKTGAPKHLEEQPTTGKMYDSSEEALLAVQKYLRAYRLD